MKTLSHYQSILSQLVRLSWPIVLAFLMQTSYNVVDIFWVGRLGPTAIAAVSLAGIMFYIILAIGQVIGSGTVALVAQSYGAELKDKANEVVRQSLMLTFLVALVIGIAGHLFSKNIIALLGGSDDVLILGNQYLQIVFIGFIFQLLSFTINYAFRGTGNMLVPMLIVGIATIINIILDPLLILGIGGLPRMGVKGAAIATMIANIISFLFGFILLTIGTSGLRLRMREKWQFHRRITKKILSVGVPAGISYTLMFLSVMAVFRLVAGFSDYALAALGIGQRVLQFAGLPIVGLGVATTTLVGQSLGARDTSRAYTVSIVAIIISVALMVLFSIVFFTSAPMLMMLFSTHPAVVQYGRVFMRIVSFYLVFSGLTITITGVYRGAGNMLPPMVAGFLKLFILVVLAYVISYYFKVGVQGAWWAMLISYTCEGLLMTGLFATRGWQKKGLALLADIRSRS